MSWKRTRKAVAEWHPRGRWGVGFGLLALILAVGFGALMFFEQAALFAALGAMGAFLALILGSFSLLDWGKRASHFIGRNRWLQLMPPLLLVAVILLWAFPGRAQIREASCGELDCPAPGIRLRFGMVETWIVVGESPLLDADLTLKGMQEILYQELSCVAGLQGIDPVTEQVRDEVDLLLDGTLQIQGDLRLTVQLLDPRTHQRLQQVNEQQPLPADPVERERTLITLHINLLTKILRAMDIQLPPSATELRSILTTSNPTAAQLNTDAAALMIAHQLDAASAKLEEAIVLDPRYATAHNNLGRAYREQRQWTQAIAHYEIATELLPCVALYHYNLAFAYEEEQQYDRAIAAYKAALARNPAYTKAFNNLGYLYLQQEELAVAAQYLDQGLAIDPDDAPLHKNRGRVYLAQGDLDNAISHLQQATTLFPDYAEAHFFLAEAYDRSNRTEEACAALVAYAPLAAADALDDPGRPSAATMRSQMLKCTTGAPSP